MSKPRQQTYSQADLNKIVLEYLNKKGYFRTEIMLRHEASGAPLEQPFPTLPAHSQPPGTQPLLMKQRLAPTDRFRPVSDRSRGSTILAEIEGQAKDPRMYFRGYRLLRDWVDASLDMYRDQLKRLLYPVFVNCFVELVLLGAESAPASEFFERFKDDHIVEHGAEVVAMLAAALAEHLAMCGVTERFREHKYRVRISSVCVYLALFFLNENTHVGGDVVIRLMNQHMELDIGDDSASDVGGTSFDNVAAYNSREVKLGLLPRDETFDKEVENELRLKDQKTQASGEDSLVTTFESIKNEPANPTVGGEKNGTLLDHTKKNDANFASPAKDALPLPPKTALDVKRAVQHVQDARARVRLSLDKGLAMAPSVCMYTLHNTLGDATCVEFDAAGQVLAAGFEDLYIQLWSLDGKPLLLAVRGDPDNSLSLRKLIGHSGAVYLLSFLPDGTYLLSSLEDGTVRLWLMDTFTTLVVYRLHNAPVWDVRFSPLGHYFVSGSHDGTARMWSVDHVYPLRMFVGHSGDVECVEWFPNTCYCFTGLLDRTIRMWDVLKGECVRLFVGHLGPVSCLAVEPRGRFLASAGEDLNIVIWDISSGKPLKTMRGHAPKSLVYSLAFLNDGSVLVSGGSDNCVRVWDVRRNAEAGEDKKKEGTSDHLGAFFTKLTGVYKVGFTRRGLCLAGGVFE